ncbi:armadillo repeat containing 5 [Chamberlinius hualienensis]
MEGAVKQLKRNTAVYNTLLYIRKKLLKEDGGIAKLREYGGLKLILYHIQNPDEKVVDIASSILGNCCLEAETRKLVRELGGISFVVSNLESSKSESILNRSCRVLANLSTDVINADEIHRKNAVQRLIDILPTAKDINYLQSALRALRLLSSAPRHRETVIRIGGVDCLGNLLVQTNNETSENVLLGILKALSTLSEDSESWTVWNCLKSEHVEALVTRINDPRSAVEEIALHILSNLSKEQSFRPVLGNAGIVPVLVKKVDLWESNSSAWQFAVDCLCQCTREAVNRAKIRQEGGLKILIRLLKDENDDRLWHRGLASIIHFEYDDASYSSLVDLGMVKALQDKLEHLTSIEEQAQHEDDEPFVDATLELHNEETMNNFPPLNLNDSCDFKCSPRSDCYSPECSPPYCAQFFPHSPVVQPYLGYSPGRSISPDSSEQQGEFSFCYSPVYEWEVSDGSDSEVSSAKAADDVANSAVEIEEDISRTQETPVDDCNENELTKSTDSSGRSPLTDILMIFSRLSLTENPTAIFLNGDNSVLAVIMDYVNKVKHVHQKSVRIINRILRNPHCLEKIILMRIPSMIVRKMIKSGHQSLKCSTCSSKSGLGESFIGELSLQAESAFGYGIIKHLLESSYSSSEKVSAAVAATLLIRTSKGRRKIFVESAGFLSLIGDSDDLSESDKIEAANGLALFTVCLNLLPANDSDSSFEKPNENKSCRFVSYNEDNEMNCLNLRVSNDENCVRVVRDVLASKSEVFNAMLKGSFAESRQNEVLIQSVSFKALTCFIHYIYACRTINCQILDESISNDPVGVFCDALALADRFLMFDIKNDIATDVIQRQKHKQYKSDEITEIYTKSRFSNCSVLAAWSVAVLLTGVYENSEIRQSAFKSLISTGGSTTKSDVQTYLTSELLKTGNNILWTYLKEELHNKFI